MTRARVLLPCLLQCLLPCLVLAGPALLARPAQADGAEPARLPADTLTVVGFPTLGPAAANDEPTLRAWCTEAVDLGRRYATHARSADRRHGGDLLFSAAVALARHAHARGEAAALFADAVDAYPPADPTRGITLVRWAAHEAWRGNMPAVNRLLARIEAWTGSAPRDLGVHEAWRWDGLAGALRERLPAVRAAWHEAHGRFGAAAVQLELLARTDVGGRGASVAAHLWERAARLRYRASDVPAALHAVERAVEHEDDDRRLAALRFWRLQAAHGLLHPGDASPRVTGRWPGPAYERDLHAYLRSIQGLAGVGTKYLALGSSAFMARRYETALRIYRLALADPVLVARARHDPLIWRGFLLGYEAALALERFDEAERLLGTIERIADEPIEEKDAFLLAIRRAREARRQRQAPGPRAGRPRAGDGGAAAAPRKRLGRIEVGRSEVGRSEVGRSEAADAHVREPPAPPPTSRRDPAPFWPWVPGALLLVATLLTARLLARGVLAWLRRRRVPRARSRKR